MGQRDERTMITAGRCSERDPHVVGTQWRDTYCKSKCVGERISEKVEVHT